MLNELANKYVRTIMNLKNLRKFNFSSDLKDYLTPKDHMISGFFKDGSARFVISDISDTLGLAHERFEIYDKEKIEQLGIAYNTTIIMNSFLQGEERIKLNCQYFKDINQDQTEMTTIYSESIRTGEVRGFIEESKIENSLLKNDKTPFLKISKILYNQPQEVYGVIKLLNNFKLTEDDIFKYFEESEQIRTHVFFNHGIIEKSFKSQGFILQKMPDCNLSELEKIFYRILGNQHFMEIKKTGLSISLLKNLFEELKIDVEVTRTPIQFFCRCSKDQFMKVLKHMNKQELRDMMEKNQATITCKNCNTNYTLLNKDFEELLKI